VARFERDTLMRQVRQLADMIAALVLRARAEGSYESGLAGSAGRGGGPAGGGPGAPTATPTAGSSTPRAS
jgi:hypothetical protein